LKRTEHRVKSTPKAKEQVWFHGTFPQSTEQHEAGNEILDEDRSKTKKRKF
jgi:hypothetical protein